jgi:hypothetical protein
VSDVGKVAIHDDDCGEVLDRYGRCPVCRFIPDMQSVALVDVKGALARLRRLEQLEQPGHMQTIGAIADALPIDQDVHRHPGPPYR